MPKDTRKRNAFLVRCEPDMAALLKQAANDLGMSREEYVRRVLAERLDTQPATETAPREAEG